MQGNSVVDHERPEVYAETRDGLDVALVQHAAGPAVRCRPATVVVAATTAIIAGAVAGRHNVQRVRPCNQHHLQPA